MAFIGWRWTRIRRGAMDSRCVAATRAHAIIAGAPRQRRRGHLVLRPDPPLRLLARVGRLAWDRRHVGLRWAARPDPELPAAAGLRLGAVPQCVVIDAAARGTRLPHMGTFSSSSYGPSTPVITFLLAHAFIRRPYMCTFLLPS